MPEDLWAADVDKAQISQVIQNLVINATQAMAAGGVLRVTASNQRIGARSHPVLAEGDYVRISVADTGEGIPPEHIGRIFDPYFTTKLQGHGLGLATVFSIIRRHQGHIEVESTLGRGSTFTIWLPAAKAQQPDPPASKPFEGSGAKGRILFMDDEEPILEVAKSTLENFGYRVAVARNGAEAVSIYAMQRTSIAVVLTDMAMPIMDGPAMIVALKAINPEVKIIGSSGLSGPSAVAASRVSGVSEFVPKPYSADTLLGAISRAIGGAEAPAS